LGIGGAEQLVLNLATASVSRNSNYRTVVQIYTSHCDQSHCFDQVKKPFGSLCDKVLVRGEFLPPNVFGLGTALCSTLRMLYITACAITSAYRTFEHDADEELIFVLDVLPTSIPLIRFFIPRAAVLFYCHFPDKLLTRDTVNGADVKPTTETLHSNTLAKNFLLLLPLVSRVWRLLKRFYRSVLDFLEECTMRKADMIVVNSNFTKGEVGRVFPSLMEPVFSFSESTASSIDIQTSERRLVPKIKVLYPCLDLDKFITPDKKQDFCAGTRPLVSLNRFERKKNIALLIYAYKLLVDRARDQPSDNLGNLPHLIIAGGYDKRNQENVEYLIELKSLAFDTLELDREKVLFRPSISDEERAILLTSAICLCYTPHREHFGIVPLEAMYAGTPVVAIRSGGPMETIKHGVTGFLVDHDDHSSNKTKQGFCDAIMTLLLKGANTEMSQAGHEHVKNKFGLDKFKHDWTVLLDECQRRCLFRLQQYASVSRRQPTIFLPRIDPYLLLAKDCMIDFCVVVAIIWFLRKIGWIPLSLLEVLGLAKRSLLLLFADQDAQNNEL